MDFVNQAIAQVSDLFRSMTPAARITAALLLAVVVVSLGFLFQQQSGSADDYLLGATAFTSSDLAEMEKAFGKAGLNDYEIRSNQVCVPRGKRAAYMAALADEKALPADLHDHFGAALDRSSPWDDSKTKQARIKVAKQKELADIIGMMRGIENARVHYDEILHPGIRRQRETTASVSVKPAGSETLDDERIESVRELIAASFAGLNVGQVSVTDLNSGITSVGSGSDGVAGSRKDAYHGRKMVHERAWTEKIQKALSFIPEAVVAVNVELNPEFQSESASIKYDVKPVARNVREDSKMETVTSAGPAGRPGAVPNATVVNQAMAVSPGGTNESTKEETTSNTENALGRTHEHISKVPLVPNRVTCTVSIPDDYYVRVWREQNPPAEGEEPKMPDEAELTSLKTDIQTRVEKVVVNLLPAIPPDVDKYEQVAVQTFTRVKSDAVVGPGTGERAMSWFASNWRAMGMALLGLVSLLMLRNMARYTPPAPATPEVEPLALPAHDEEEAEADESREKILQTRFTDGAPNVREELSEIVRDDPDAAATILRSWIGEAS